MNMNVQIIKENNKPAFAVIPYSEFEQIQRKLAIVEEKEKKASFPLDVAEMHTLKGYSLIKAWRIYKGKTQREMAGAMGITQGAFSQIEKSESNHAETLKKIAKILNLDETQLDSD